MRGPDSPVLLVDDDDDDRFLVRQAWNAAGVKNPLREAANGLTAVAYLSGAREFSDRSRFPVPALILLDVMMPGMTGFSVLDYIRRDPATALTPVIMLTASTAPQDVEEAYRRGANSFVIKPSSFAELVDAVRALDRYWLGVNEYPAPPADV